MNLISYSYHAKKIKNLKFKVTYPEIRNTLEPSKGKGWVDIPEDVKLEILSYLNPSELRAMSQINHESYRMTCSRQAWEQYHNKIWPFFSEYADEGYHIRLLHNDLKHEIRSKESDNINFKMLHAFSGKYPCQMDTKNYSKLDHYMCFQNYVMTSSITNCNVTKNRQMNVYQLRSTVWLDEVCLRSDLPFPVPKKATPTQLVKLLSLFFSRNRRKLFMQPFISPFATKLEFNDRPIVEMNLSPRFVAYYEVTLLPRDVMQEPACSMSSTRLRSIPECVAIGISLRLFNTYRKMPGWDIFSYGYHSDDGGMFHSEGQTPRSYGPTFTTGDTVGLGIDYIKQAIFFTHNGNFLGYPWKDIDLTFEWYPTVGVDTENPLEINFGKVPFVFDLRFFFLDRHLSFLNSNKRVSSIYD